MVDEKLPIYFSRDADPYKLNAYQETKSDEAEIKKGLNIANPYWYFKPFGLKKSTFSKFLDESGINASITRVLSDIYDTPEKPPYPIHYFRKHFAYFDPNIPNVEFLIEFLNEKREELTKLREKNKKLKSILSEYDDVHLEPLQFQPMRNVKISSGKEYLAEDKLFWSSTSTEEIDLENDSVKRKAEESISTSTTFEEGRLKSLLVTEKWPPTLIGLALFPLQHARAILR